MSDDIDLTSLNMFKHRRILKKNYDVHKDYRLSSNDLLSFVHKLEKSIENRSYKRDYLDNTSDFYLLYNKCNAVDFNIEFSQNRSKYSKNSHELTPFSILKKSNIADGYNMKSLILNKIANGKLKYSARKQIHNIDIKNRLYKLRIKGNQCVISVASKYDFLALLHQLDKFLSND